MQRLASIQCLRFLAASAVVVAHTSSGNFLYGGFGVDLFFVLSGFIITRVMPNAEPRRFALDRFTRIYPIYWLALAPMVLLTFDGNGARLLGSITLTPLFGHVGENYLKVGWTLYFEMLFYAAALVALWRRWTGPLLVGAWLVLLVASRGLESPLLDFLGNAMILEFLLGVGIARLPASEHRWGGGAAIMLGLAGAWAFAAEDFGYVHKVFDGSAGMRAVAWGVPAALIAWGALQFETLLRHPRLRFLSLGGDASYSIYLSHPIFLLARPDDPVLLFVLGTPLLILLGIAVHLQVERPLIALARRWTGIAPARVDGAPAVPPEQPARAGQ